MVVFKRFPKIHPLPREEQHLVPPDKKGDYPAFAKDFDTLDEIVMPTFRALDNDALIQQNYYRWTYVILIFVGSLATIFGIFQIAFQSTDWPGIVETVIAAILSIGTGYSRSFKHQERYFDKRLAAEELRSIYFLFLGHHTPYEDERTSEARLREQVELIKLRARH